MIAVPAAYRSLRPIGGVVVKITLALVAAFHAVSFLEYVSHSQDTV